MLNGKTELAWDVRYSFTFYYGEFLIHTKVDSRIMNTHVPSPSFKLGLPHLIL